MPFMCDWHLTCTGEVIKAWDIAVATMKIGEICRITCKPEYAYGSAGSPPKIPPNATLIFEVSEMVTKTVCLKIRVRQYPFKTGLLHFLRKITWSILGGMDKILVWLSLLCNGSGSLLFLKHLNDLQW